MLQHMAGLEPDLTNQTLKLRPSLLPWLDELHFENLRLGKRRVSIHIWREAGHVRWSVDGGDGLQIVS
jgi:hypothetical protein